MRVPGQKLGESQSSEVYAYGDGDIVKLFKGAVNPRVVEHEVATTRAAFASGAPAPEVRRVIEIDGRRGIVYPRYDGETLLKLVFAGEVRAAEAGAIMAHLAHTIHAGCHQASVWTFREWVLFNLGRLERKGVPDDMRSRVRDVMLQLPEGGVLCHGDLHPDNILMTAEGPVAIDWTSALMAAPLVDVARQHVSFTLMLDAPVESSDDLRQVVPGVEAAPSAIEVARRDADAAFIGTYAALAGQTPDELLAAIAPYMAVMAAMRMVEAGCTPEEQRRLIAYVRAHA